MTNTESAKIILPKSQSSMGINPIEQAAGTTTPSAIKKAKTRTKLPPIESVEQLIRAIYSGTFKRSTLDKAELAAMRSSPAMNSSQRDELLNLTLSDRTLDRTRQLMLINTRLEGSLTGQLGEFARAVLGRHPAFSTESLAGVLDNLPEAATEDKAVHALISQDYMSLLWPEGTKTAKKKDGEQCKANAVHCLLLLFRATRGTSIERIQRHLQIGLWAPVGRRYKSEVDMLHALLNTRDAAAASITHALLEKQVLEHSRNAQAARSSEERATSRASQLEEQLTGVEEKLATAQAEADRLTNQLQQATQAHANDSAHWKDDYEKLRGQVLRRLKDELSLLDEGLQALRRDPPKVHVMVDHAERAIDGLKMEMERLRGGN